MRSEAEVREKLDVLLASRLRKHREEFLSRSPRNCAFNTRLRVKGVGRTGFCQNQTVLSALKTRVFVCNDDDTAASCKCFSCKNTQASVDAGFRRILESPSLCGEKLPKIAMLLWVVQKRIPSGRWQRFRHYLKDLCVLVRVLILFRWW